MPRRTETDRLRELIRLHRMGLSARRIARLLRMSPNTQRRYLPALDHAGLLAGAPDELPAAELVAAAADAAFPPAPARPCSLAPWLPRIEALRRKGLSARATHDRLRLETPAGEEPFRGSYSAVKRAFRRIKREQGPSPQDVALPIESSPGEAQVDFGYAGRLFDPATGRLRRAWVWVLLLCHSRLMVVRLVFDQRIETWLELHEQAFAELGAVPTVLVPDNTRRAVLRAAFGIDGPTELERSYRELAQRYGFVIDPAPPGAPRKRGKVEASVKHLRRNPLAGRDGEPLPLVQDALLRWNREVASTRVHGSTGRRPIDVFEQEERATLLPLPVAPGDRAVWKRATVHPDGHVTCRGRLFSVPWPLVHERLWTRACGRTIEVFLGDRRVALHQDTGRRRTTQEEHLPQDRRELRYRGRAVWEARARRIGPETLALVGEVFDQDPVLSHLRQVQAIVTLFERHPRARAEAASARARRTGERGYREIKQALAEGLDLLDPAPRPRAAAVASVRPELRAPPAAPAVTAVGAPPTPWSSGARTPAPSPRAAGLAFAQRALVRVAARLMAKVARTMVAPREPSALSSPS